MLKQTGTIYILENSEAGRVKVGVTINNPDERLIDVNRMWLGAKGRCQICLSWRLLAEDGLLPKHVLSGRHCPGSNQLPFGKSTVLAEKRLRNIQGLLNELHGSEKIAAIKKIKTLEKTIEVYRRIPKRVGSWRIHASFFLKNAYCVEIIAHEFLMKYADKTAPFGEVFDCSVEEAMLAVNNAIAHLGLRE